MAQIGSSVKWLGALQQGEANEGMGVVTCGKRAW